MFWKIYAILFFVAAWSDLLQIVNPNSQLEMYYNITIIFSNWFVLPYFFNILSTLINFLVCILIFGYAFNVRNMPRPPRWMFYLRLLSDGLGHSYAAQIIQASFAQGGVTGFVGILSLAFLVFPSYLLQARLTFTQKLKGPLNA